VSKPQGEEMNKIIMRPKDDYSEDWAKYWAQNPNLRKGVGADGVNDGGDGGDGGGDGGGLGGDGLGDGGGDADTVSMSEFTEMKSQLDALLSEKTKLANNNKSLLEEKTAAQRKAKEKEREILEQSGTTDDLKRAYAADAAAKEEENKAFRDADTKRFNSISGMLTEGALKKEAQEIASSIAREGFSQALIPDIAQRLKSSLVDADADGNYSTEVKYLGSDGREFYGDKTQFIKDISNTDYLMQMIKGPMANGSGNPASGSVRAKVLSREEYDADPAAGSAKLAEGYVLQ